MLPSGSRSAEHRIPAPEVLLCRVDGRLTLPVPFANDGEHSAEKLRLVCLNVCEWVTLGELAELIGVAAFADPDH